MPLNKDDVGDVVSTCQEHRHRVRYGVLGAAISHRVGNLQAVPRSYGKVTGTLLNKRFGGRCPSACWVVGGDGNPTGYDTTTRDPHWTATTPLHDDVPEFLAWLDATVPEWDRRLKSTYP